MTDEPAVRPLNGGSRPVPDPTELTDRAIARLRDELTNLMQGGFAVRDERLRGIDTATALRLEQVTRTHDSIQGDIDRAVEARTVVVNERFNSVAQQFVERDVRSERESKDNKVAVDAAFAAQKEAAAAENKANREAIDKSERATAETIKTNQDLNRATTDNLTKQLDELKQAVTRIESRGIGASETRVEGRLSTGALVSMAGLAIAAIIAAVTVVVAIMP